MVEREKDRRESVPQQLPFSTITIGTFSALSTYWNCKIGYELEIKKSRWDVSKNVLSLIKTRNDDPKKIKINYKRFTMHVW